METFVEGKDYYFNEEGLMVLTREFLLKRGFCCGRGCLHCPYTGTPLDRKEPPSGSSNSLKNNK